MGWILDYLVNNAGPIQKNPELVAIYKQLEDINYRRMNIKELLSQSIFGILSQKRSSKDFFADLRANVPDKEVHSYTIRAVEPGDFFLTLVAPLKPLYELAQNLENKFKLFDALFEDKMETIDKDAIYKKYAFQLEAMRTVLLKYTHEHNSIIMKINQNQFALENKSAVVMSMENLLEAILKKSGQIEQLVVDKLNQKEACKKLIKTVEDSVEVYSNALKEENAKKKPGLFTKRHGPAGETRAKELLDIIKESKASSEVRLEIIFDFLKNAKGNWQDPFSFKTVLAGKIAATRNQSLEEFIGFIKARKDSGLYEVSQKALRSTAPKKTKT
ncbi:MAG: hypothetical protein ABI597_05655 [Gammaproteobacteria bacterium]